MILYADIFMLINAFCNWISLLSCGKLLSLRIRYGRITMGAVILSIYAFVNVFLRINGIFAVAFHITVLCLGCVAAYGFQRPAQLFKVMTVFFISCVFMGGLAGWICGIAGSKLIIALMLTPAIYGIWTLVSRNSLINLHQKPLNVVIDGVHLKGLADSGNLMCDPDSGLPMIVVSSQAVFLSDYKKIFDIEISTPAGNAVLRCFRPNRVTVGKTDVCAAVAISENGFGEYDCIVPVRLI